MSAWTRAAVEALGPVTNVPTAAAIVGVNAETIYTAIRNGTWTATRVLRIGRVIKIPTLDILRLLYAPEVEASGPVPTGIPACHHDGTPQVMAGEIALQPQCQCGYPPAPSGEAAPLRSVV